jgi:hypothetical protein
MMKRTGTKMKNEIENKQCFDRREIEERGDGKEKAADRIWRFRLRVERYSVLSGKN